MSQQFLKSKTSQFSELWCSDHSGVCETIDFDRKISYFSDANHHNAYGALRIGQFVRDLYDKWAEDKTKTEIRRHPLNLNDKPVEKAKLLMNEAVQAIGQSNMALSNFAFNWLEHLRLGLPMDIDDETRKMLLEFHFNEFDFENIRAENEEANRKIVEKPIDQKTKLASLHQLTNLLDAKQSAPSSLKELLSKNSKMANLLLQIIEQKKAEHM